MNTTTNRPIHQIADEILGDWQNVHFAAKPYLQAMHFLETTGEFYGSDSAKTIILYFLGNATTWRGETAKRIKKELKELIK